MYKVLQTTAHPFRCQLQVDHKINLVLSVYIMLFSHNHCVAGLSIDMANSSFMRTDCRSLVLLRCLLIALQVCLTLRRLRSPCRICPRRSEKLQSRCVTLSFIEQKNMLCVLPIYLQLQVIVVKARKNYCLSPKYFSCNKNFPFFVGNYIFKPSRAKVKVKGPTQLYAKFSERRDGVNVTPDTAVT